MNRGDVHWCDFGAPVGSGPAKRRPVVVIQSDDYNRSRLATTIVLTLTTNTATAALPGNVFLPAAGTGLPKDSVANVTSLITVDRRDLDARPVGRVPDHLMAEVDQGLRVVLALGPLRR
ncbi:type II toxin-antitoxin system PemK/MazF family toxin [Nocardioides nitrophenolicus]|uniref:type II toxin-antitoxin system PemK/MazF family toxin n=1 Tax=Nocardioides nitrophenolicus TaxID=60489 RepID=UPI0027DC1BDB|nr:type II toxin-antitoxin system PemK/MazF family toxin [Nocardioides nitrophenolicus]MBM7515776.1 mRNA interferase MazF [Nocardioides nitrophenolicus]